MVLGALPAQAARPLLDKHQWDAYFALFARDSDVPWKPTTVRLDTYSGAPVDFAAYDVDPADVIVAGRSRSARPLETARLHPVVRWRFAPPAGYRFESSDVPVPLGSREGFFVVEARRGDAVQQVWINRTHVGLLTKESPEGLVVWAADLRSGRAIPNMHVAFLVGLRLVDLRTDARGTIVWRGRMRPAFVLAEHGAGRAFVSILPQAPPAASLVGLRVESAVVRAGEALRFVGFARRRSGGTYRSAGGDARIVLGGRGKTLAATTVRLDAAGAFAGELLVPPGTESADDTLLASAAGGVGGTTVRVDGATDIALTIRSNCPCDPSRDVVLAVSARRSDAPAPGTPVHVRIVRSPHVGAPGEASDAPRWGTTLVYDRDVRTDSSGAVHVVIATPSDGLDSTYGIRATSCGAQATTRVVVPNGKVALALLPDAPTVDVGQAVGFTVRAFDPDDGAPAAGVSVDVRLSHGATALQRTVRLDARGDGRVVFAHGSLGSNLALASALAGDRRALDAAAVLVEPTALSATTTAAPSPVSIRLGRERFRPGERIDASASVPGAAGDALLTLEGERIYGLAVAPVSHGNASARLMLGDSEGLLRVGAAFVRDGALATGTEDVRVDGPGHARLTGVALDKPAYAPGEVLHATVHDGGLSGGATVAVRVADGRESGAALFDDAPDVMESGATLAQAPASANPGWHAYVAPARSKASDIFAAERPRKAPTEVPSLGAAAPRTAFWRVARANGATLDVPVPKEPGRYLFSILKISDDGDVGSASASFTVE